MPHCDICELVNVNLGKCCKSRWKRSSDSISTSRLWGCANGILSRLLKGGTLLFAALPELAPTVVPEGYLLPIGLQIASYLLTMDLQTASYCSRFDSCPLVKCVISTSKKNSNGSAKVCRVVSTELSGTSLSHNFAVIKKWTPLCWLLHLSSAFLKM